MARKKKSRKSKTTIFIACEGRNTEPIYFERIKEEVEPRGVLAISIYPDGGEVRPKNHALGLVELAVERKGSFDELWVVFDKDGYTKHLEAFQLAKKEGVRVAFSSIAFEHWVLLHFERNAHSFKKSRNIISEKFKAGSRHYPDYNKSNRVDIYPRIKSRTEAALQNASWLRYWQSQHHSGLPFHRLNPVTTVDQLVARLLGLESDIWHWGALGSTLTFSGWAVETALLEQELLLLVRGRGRRAILPQNVEISLNGKLLPPQVREQVCEELRMRIALPSSGVELSVEYMGEVAVFLGF